MSSYSIGVDLGGTNLRIAALDSDGNLLEKLTLGAEVNRGRDYVIGEMCSAIQSMRTKFSATGVLSGIGIGVPGFIDMDAGMVMDSPNLPDWTRFPVRELIEERLGTKVILENDANAAALGEKWLGAGRDYEHMIMYTLGTGVGGGIVLNGRVWHGMNGMAGELGHFTVYADGNPCGCGSKGCLEQYASATAVVRMAREAIARGEATELERSSKDNVEFSSTRHLPDGDPGRHRRAESLRESRRGAGDWNRIHGQRAEFPDLCHWRRSFQRLGRLRPEDVFRDEVALVDLWADLAGTSRARTEAHDCYACIVG